ncbi:hypothetical protein AB0B89_31970 [Sphaerisporangium sp. NPDC049002]
MPDISMGRLAMVAVAWALVGVAWLLDSGRFPIIGKRYRAWLYDGDE